MLLFCLCAFGLNCTEEKLPGSALRKNGDRLTIVFRWPGDDMANRQQLENRDRIARRIKNEGIGRVVRAGTGMGWMELVVAVEDKQSARRKIEQIVNAQWPGARFSIQHDGH
jgi:hypothetical protein